MDTTRKAFLEILRAAMKGEKASPDRELQPEEWQQLFGLAEIHHILPLIYEAVFDLPGMPAPLREAVKGQARTQVIRQTLRTSEFLELYRQLEAAGVRPLVVKGLICRNLYPKPDQRPSGDEDILIEPARFDLCCRVLTDYGLKTSQTPEEQARAYEIPYRGEGSALYIELHKQLFPPESRAYGALNGFFADVFSRTAEEKIQGQTVYTLCPSDHLFYLICHAFKHFLHSGFGIRQVCDIVLYANRYGHQVDWTALLENCRAIRAEKFAGAIFRIGREHLTFDPELAAFPECWRQIPVDPNPMLEDLLAGGLYGDASLSRKHSSNITLDAVAAEKQGRAGKSALMASLFPGPDKLEGRYPYLKKHPWLVPAAWCSRLLRYAGETRTARDSSAAEALKIGNDRVALMKYYDIL